ncbi:hypothetical protein D030_0634 [Vibrio parahaemolyticus AQ3810]|nr:hypothetical protein D030_0634 [Vibrio parahaemolyticus AQ3810]
MNCTALASAKNSRWREIAALIMLPNKVPNQPSTKQTIAISMMTAKPLFESEELRDT